MTDVAKRVHKYNQNLREFQLLQALVALPRFNADHYPDVCNRIKVLSERLKEEANALWELRINVY